MQDNVVITHERWVYTLMDLMGDLGGVMDVLIFIGGIFISPYSEFNFNMTVIENLYKVKTPASKWRSNSVSGPNDKKYNHMNQKIDLGYCQVFKLFFLQYFSCIISKCCYPQSKREENEKLMAIYEKGLERFDEELSIDYIFRVVGEAKKLLQQPKMSVYKQNKAIDQYNVIDLDKEDDEEEDEQHVTQGLPDVLDVDA